MRDYNRELTESEINEIARLRRKNYSYREIGQLMNISLYRATILAKRWENSQKEEDLEALRKENASLKNEIEYLKKSFFQSNTTQKQKRGVNQNGKKIR